MEDFRIELTVKQDKIYYFIVKFFIENKCPPTYRNIAEHFNFTVKGAVDHVAALKKKNWVKDYKKIIPNDIEIVFTEYQGEKA